MADETKKVKGIGRPHRRPALAVLGRRKPKDIKTEMIEAETQAELEEYYILTQSVIPFEEDYPLDKVGNG
jgi:hypothetical protein